MDKTYAELLKHPLWQEKRLEVFRRDGFKCRNCHSKEKTLHIHHIRYAWGKKPWEYDIALLKALCEDCHEDAGKLQKKIRAALDELAQHAGSAEQWVVLGFIQGVVAGVTGAKSIPIEMGNQIGGVGAAFELPGRSAHAALSGSNEAGWQIDTERLWNERCARFEIAVAPGPDEDYEPDGTGV